MEINSNSKQQTTKNANNIHNPTCHNKHPSTWRGETRVLTSFTARFPEILQLVQLLLVKNRCSFFSLPRPIKKKNIRNTIKINWYLHAIKKIKLCKCNQKFSINLKTTSVSTKKRTSQRSSGNFLLTKISWRIWARPSFCSALKPRKPEALKNSNCESETSRTLAHMYTRIPAAHRVVGVFFKKSVCRNLWLTHVSLWFNSCFIWLP